MLSLITIATASSILLSVDEWPLTPAGKIDRKALVEIAREYASSKGSGSGEHDKEMNQKEREIAAVWEKVLGVSGLKRSDSFYAVGGDSIRAIRVVHALHEAGIQVTAAELLANPTIAALASSVQQSGTAHEAGVDEPGVIEATPVMQWFAGQEQDSEADRRFNQATLLKFKQEVDSEVLQKALLEIASHHAALRIRMDSKKPARFSIAPHDSNAVNFITEKTESDSKEKFAKIADKLHSAIDPVAGPVFAAAHISSGKDSWVMLVAHHLCVDYVSWGIICDDLAVALADLRAGREIHLAPNSTGLREWIDTLKEKAEPLAAQIPFWERQLEGKCHSLEGYSGQSAEQVCISDIIYLQAEEVQNLKSAGCSSSRLAWPQLLAGLAFASAGSTFSSDKISILIEHGALANLAAWIADTMYDGLDNPVSETWIPPLPFDASFHSLLGALVHGHSLLVPDEETRSDPVLLLEFMRKNNSTVANVTPTYFAALLDTLEDDAWPGQLVILGAESIPASLLERFYSNANNTGVIICNMYGPTEACVEVAYHRMTSSDWNRQVPIPIGTAVRNTSLRIVDRFGKEAANGIPGELYIEGACLARGYHKRPEESAAAFVPSPLENNSRSYKTGDRARRLSDGAIVFLGRADRQIKIHGHRIEPAHVEQHLNQYAGINSSAVLAVKIPGQPDDRKKLVAFVVANDIDQDAVRTAMRGQLAHYMVPDAVVAINKLPLTANNKLDEKKLAEIYCSSLEEQGGQKSEFKAANDTEKQLAEIWQETLSAWPVSHTQSFFDAGGNSLSAMRFTGRIRSRLGCELKLRDLYENSAFNQIAEYIASNSTSGNDSPTASDEASSEESDNGMTDEEMRLLDML